MLALPVVLFGVGCVPAKMNFVDLPPVPVPDRTFNPPKLPATFEVIPSQVNFGKILLGKNRVETLVVKNTSKFALKVTPGSLSETTFQLVSSQCDILSPGQQCAMTVSYTPTQKEVNQDLFTVDAVYLDTQSLPQEIKRDVEVRGEGFFNPPSALDRPAFVGWFSFRMSDKVTLDNTQAGFTNCQKPNTHGAPEVYCFEPSGANGMVFGANSNTFNTLSQFILNQPTTEYRLVRTLDDLFNGASKESDNKCLKEALFYYALSYLILPPSEPLNDPNWDRVTFHTDEVDDGIQLIANGHIAGHMEYGDNPTRFSVHRGKGLNMSNLKNGANTLVANWVDDCRVKRELKGSSLLVDGVPVEPLIPNVIRGYMYDRLTGNGLAGLSISIEKADGSVAITNTDNQGFYEISDIPNGTHLFRASGLGRNFSTPVTVDHRSQNTAIKILSEGL